MMRKEYSPEEVLKILRACNHNGLTAQDRCDMCPAQGRGCTDFGNEEIAADAIEKLLEQVRWIPVAEKLPELIHVHQIPGHGYSEAVQICTNGKKVMTAIYSDVGWLFPETFWQAENETVTHWRPVVGNLPWEGEEC